MTLPRAAVKENKVQTLKKNVLKNINVLILGTKPDSVFVRGLTNGQLILLEQVEEVDNSVKYEGITR